MKTPSSRARVLFAALAIQVALLPAFGQQFEARKYLSPTPGIAEGLGYSVAIDGEHAVAGGLSGTVHVFDPATAQLRFALVPASGSLPPYFGVSAGVSGDVAIVGASLDVGMGGATSGAAYLFDLTTGAEMSTRLIHDGRYSGPTGRH